MAAKRKAVQKVLNMVLDAGYGNEKEILAMSAQDMIDVPNIKLEEVGIIIELQKAIKANHVITYLAGEEAGAEDGK